MTTLNKFKKFMSNLKDATGKKLEDIFGKIKTFLSNPGNIVSAIKTRINVEKNIKDMKDSKGENLKDILIFTKNNVLP
jgi:uncharacterized protein YvpB